MVASLPVLVNLTASAENHAAQSLRRFDFRGRCSRKMRSFRHCLRNDFSDSRMRVSLDEAPNDIMKSMYSLPSASQTCEPLPRSRKSELGL